MRQPDDAAKSASVLSMARSYDALTLGLSKDEGVSLFLS